MIAYLLIPLALVFIFDFLDRYIEAPNWLWDLLILLASGLALAPWGQKWLQWYSPFAIAGTVVLLRRLENLLIAKADEAVNAILRRR